VKRVAGIIRVVGQSMPYVEKWIAQAVSSTKVGVDPAKVLAEITPRASIARGPEAYTLRALVRAIETRSAIDVYYQSLTRTGMRTICPHAFVHDGYRWHCRALSVESGEFRDYVLGRILSISTPKPSNVDPSDDVEWNTRIKLRLTAHPGLDPRQKEAIEHDYRMEDGELFITMRLAAAFCFVKRYNLDLQDNIEPARQQLLLTNLAELNSALHSAKEQSKLLIAQRAKDSTG
jgi:predicted DNA-binding transcriptional regulator YafY